MVSVYSGTHFFIDFACAFLMFSSIVHYPDWLTYILIYNFCAFAMQMPIGIIADKLNRNQIIASVGCILVGISLGFTSIPLVATILLGLGNGMFHIGGGIDILNISEEKSAALGIFVSPGAFGVYFGTLLGRADISLRLPILLVLLAAAWYIFTMKRASKEPAPHFLRSDNGDVIASNTPFLISVSKRALIVMICLFLVVVLRSYVGLAVDFPWRGIEYWGLALVCASAFGKTIGGFLSDRFGPIKTALFSLGIASLLLLIPQIPIAGVTAILLFNMTMPITLWVMAKVIPGAKGFSFGLLTFALFLGFLPVHLGVSTPAFWVFAMLAAVSLMLLITGIKRQNG